MFKVHFLRILCFLIPSLSTFSSNSSKLNFNPQKAIDFWNYEVASYCAPSYLTIWDISTISAASPNVIDIEVIQNETTQVFGYTAYDADKNLAYLSFRGTISSITDWMNNLDMFKEPITTYCDGCEVHSGFWKNYLSIKDNVKDAVLRIKEKHQDAEFAFIGHSMGSALATFAFIDLYEEVHPDYFYTFEMPRMGNKEFADFMDANFQDILKVRITHYKDIIPRGPLTSMGYYHFKNEVFYSEDCSSYVICTGDEDPSCINQFSLLNFSINDHRTLFGINMHEFKNTCN